ncbi:MAG: GNAT family N-acetyltransferase [Kofleriaceae bacterium]
MRLELVDPYSPLAARIWGDLEASAPPSYFLSWAWNENWLACLPREAAPRLALFLDGDRPAAACFLGRQWQMRRGVVPTRGLHLNTTGVPRLDELLIEYNGLVGGDLSLDALIAALPGGWDELYLPGLHERALGGIAEASSLQYRVLVDRRVPAYYVDLDKVRASDYLGLLSSQTRGQVRRAQRAAGALELEVATDERQAIDIYSELTALHGAQWRAKGEPGAFADPWFDRFHRRLIAQRLRHGEIQLVRLRAGARTIGCLYNLVWRGRVLQYQSGMGSFDDAKLKPGFLCHTAAIEHAAAAGLAVYDLLAGDMRYKKSLSTDVGWLMWARVQRWRLRFVVEEQLVQLRRARRARADAPA